MAIGPEMNNNKLIIVLGMHRSGTSAITRGLEVLGVDLGGNLQSAMAGVNQKGFFEDNDVVAINEAILLTLSHEWHTPSPITRVELKNENLAGIKLMATELLREKMKLATLIAIKDPRMPILLPFWQDIIKELCIDVSYVIVIRNPLSVANSLKVRDNIEKEKSCYLWLKHVLPSILETIDSRRIVVDYDNMMEQPRVELTRIAEALGLEDKLSPIELEKFENKFLDADLRHAKYDINELISDPAVPQLLVSVYKKLIRVSSGDWPLEKKEVLNCCHQAAVSLNELRPMLTYITRQDWKVADRDGQIKNLSQVVADRDGQIKNLSQVVADRDEQIKNLSQVVADRDEQIGRLNRDIAFKQSEISHMRASRSWRITKPVRVIGNGINKCKRLFALIVDYHSRHPGVKGITRLLQSVISVYRISGVIGIIAAARHRQGIGLDVNLKSSVECLPSVPVNVELFPENVAVQLHAFHVDLLPEIRGYLSNIPVKFSLYITTDSNEKVNEIKSIFESLEQVRELVVKVTKNQGRDIAPMLIAFGEQLLNHALILHLHTKKSPHNNALRGWRTFLMNSLLGSQEAVASIFAKFSNQKSLGVFYPAPYLPLIRFMRLGGNSEYMYKLLRRSGRPSSDFDMIDKENFPAGSMFWFRSEVIRPLVEMNLSFDDFSVEASQDDGTLAHAIERMFVYYSSVSGFSSKAFLPSIMFSPVLPGAIPLTEVALEKFHDQNYSSVIIFDHDLGGGSNTYGENLINSIVSGGREVIRIYYSQEHSQWIVQIVSQLDGMFYTATDANHLFEMLATLSCEEVIVNSLYLMPDVDKVIEHITFLSQQLRVGIDYKVHDFYAICPSQHLLNSESRYCNIPSDYIVCQKCLNVNMESLWRSTCSPPTILAWRKPFSQLIEASSTISVFDISSADLLKKVYDIPNDKIIVKPHEIEGECFASPVEIENGSLHIGVLGTLTPAKGAYEINDLARHIQHEDIKVPITVVGRSIVDAESGIVVLGPYEQCELPDIIRREGINVIFMSSIIPETFSYTISEAMAMGLPIVAFDVGAQGRRVSLYERGVTVTLGSSSSTILEALNKIHNTAHRREL